MEGKEVVDVLFAEFGFREFLTRHIPPDAMDRLSKLMEIIEFDHVRNTKVGRGIGSLDGSEYTLASGQTVRMVVTRSENPHQPRRFRFVASTPAAHKPIDKAAVVQVIESGAAYYDVVLVESGYGWAAFCPALLGCCSQGEDQADALANIQEAITAWLTGESKAVKRRIRQLVYEYRAAGYPVKTAAVSVNRITE